MLDGGMIATIPAIDANGGTVAIDSIHGVDNELNEKQPSYHQQPQMTFDAIVKNKDVVGLFPLFVKV